MNKELYEYKLDLLYYGIHITDECYASLKKGIYNQINHNDYITTKGLMIALDSLIYVNAKLNKKSPYVVDIQENNYYLVFNDKKICSIKIIQPPEFALMGATLKSGKVVTDLINIHGDRIRIQPIIGCANHCTFCDLHKYSYEENSLTELDEAFTYALEHAEFRHALISGGTPLKTKEAYDYLNEVIKYFGLKYGSIYPIDVMFVPRGKRVEDSTPDAYLSFLKEMKEWKITGIYANLELYNDKARKRYIPEKSLIPKDDYFLFLKLAVEVFGKGNVKSCIIIGLESIEDSLNAVEELSKIGVIPVLSPFIPGKKGEEMPNPKLMKKVVLKSKEIVEKYDLELGPACISCRHNTIHFK